MAGTRKEFDGLSGLLLAEMGADPHDGSVDLFVNRRRNRMKLLVWESTGFTLYYKRLEGGTFALPQTGQSQISWQVPILTRISLNKVPRRKRYERT